VPAHVEANEGAEVTASPREQGARLKIGPDSHLMPTADYVKSDLHEQPFVLAVLSLALAHHYRNGQRRQRPTPTLMAKGWCH
jgi:hypothetical protein